MFTASKGIAKSHTLKSGFQPSLHESQIEKTHQNGCTAPNDCNSKDSENGGTGSQRSPLAMEAHGNSAAPRLQHANAQIKSEELRASQLCLQQLDQMPSAIMLNSKCMKPACMKMLVSHCHGLTPAPCCNTSVYFDKSRSFTPPASLRRYPLAQDDA